MEHYDLAIVGLGGIGSATVWQAAGNGQRVIGLERFALGGHHRGASHDHSRIMRHSYHTEHYVRLTFAAYEAWAEVEAASGQRCVHITGGIDLFPKGAAIDIDSYREAMLAAGVAFDELSAAEACRRWPVWNLDPEVRLLYQANTGLVSPAATVPLLQRLAVDAGATLRGDAAVAAIEPDDREVTIHIHDGTTLRAGHVVVAADAWTAELVAPLGVHLPLTVTGEQVTYYDTTTPAAFAIGAAPVWIWMDDPSFYGFPTFARGGVKVSQDCGGVAVHPDQRGFEPDQAILARTDAFVAGAFGGRLTSALDTVTCLYTLTPDRDFVIDSLPDHPNVTIALGSAHAYKFVAWFGRTLAALAAGGEPHSDLTPFRLDRPALSDPAWQPNWLV